jgi:GNAT superfamily N-acetyltransferase
VAFACAFSTAIRGVVHILVLHAQAVLVTLDESNRMNRIASVDGLSQDNVMAAAAVPSWAIEPALPNDILFLVSNVSRFADNGHFNNDLRQIRGQKGLVAAAAEAILRRYAAFRWLTPSLQFLAARSAGRTVGAALTSTCVEDDGGAVVRIDFLVVEEEFHRRGIGKALVRHVIATAHSEARIQCWCASKSKAMQCLLRSLDFKKVQRSIGIPFGDGTIVVPSCWLLDLKKTG